MSKKIKKRENIWQTIPVFIINLKTRKDRKKYIKKHLKKNGLTKFEFYNTRRHENPVIGCLESHLEVIKIAKKRKLKKVWIMEDDALFTKHINNFPEYPSEEKWDMLYPGANVSIVYNKNKINNWNKVSCLAAHSYIIKKDMYDILIKLLNEKKGEPVDVVYEKYIHQKKYVTLSHYPNLVEQLPDYSDIERKKVNYCLKNGIDDNMNYMIKKAKYEIKNGNIILKLKYFEDNELPNVSIVILTGNRRDFIDIFYYYAINFDYPKEKIEFLFLDDGNENISDIIQRDSRFKHVKLNVKGGGRVPLSQKRNIGVELSKNEYILFCDDDDYYPPSTVKARINTLLTYKEEGIECVCCTKIGLYDLNTNNSITSSGRDISEASLGFTKSFWKKQKFDTKVSGSEGMTLIKGRYEKVLSIPYSFVLIGITHNKNYTNDLRKVNESYSTEEQSNYFDDIPLFIQDKLLKIKNKK